MAKKSNKSLVRTLKFEKLIEGSPITRVNGHGWVNWGSRNDYPYRLLDLYNQSPTLYSCVSFATQSIIGDGIDYKAMKLDSNDVMPNYTQTWDEFLRCIALDYNLYGSFAIQIIRNKGGKDYSFYNIPLEQVRWSEYDEDGQITKYYICNDWTNTSKYEPIELPAFDMLDKDEIKSGKPYIYVYRSYSPSMTYYTAPCYQSALKAVLSEIEMSNYDLKHIQNGFTPTGMLSLQPVESDDDRQMIIREINSMFTNSDNTNNMLISFSNGTDIEPAKWIPFSAGGKDTVNQYEDSNQRQINRILSVFRIPSRALVGLPDQGNTGFNSEAALLETAYNLYNRLIGNQNRNAIIKTLNFLFKMQGIDTEIILKPLRFLMDNTNESNDTDVEVTENTDSDNVVEKETSINEDKTK